MSRRTLYLVVVSLAAVGCEKPAPPPPPTPTWRVEDVGTIVGAAPWEPFVKLRSLALHPDGRVATIDIGRKIVTVFAPEGRPLSVAGKVGKAVGEYEEPASLAWLSDTLAVLDEGSGRINYFTNGSKSSGQHVTLPVTGDPSVRWYPVSSAKAYLRSARMVTPMNWMSSVIAFDSRKAGDTVTIPNPPQLKNGSRCGVEGGVQTFFLWPEAAISIAIPVSPDGAMVFGVTDNYRLAIVRPGGDTAGVITGTATPIPVSVEQWTDGLKEYEKFRTRHPEMTCDLEPVRPTHRAMIRGVAASTEGDIWVTVLDASGLRFDVFGPDGKQKGSVAAPVHNTTIPISVARDRVALVVPGDKPGKEAIRVLRIVR